MRKFIADTIAMIVFSWVVGMGIEIFISGLTLEQSIKSRSTAAAINLFSGGVYGRFRDWVFVTTRTHEESGWARKMCVSTLSFVIFQMPIYTSILVYVGATMGQIISSVSAATVTSTVIGRPYDCFLMYVRRLCKVA